MPTEVEPMEETRILMKIEWNYSAKYKKNSNIFRN